MSLQKTIIQEYRLAYPTHTLRETAALTGLHLSRVFRLMNGAPMKLTEYESFHNVLTKYRKKDLGLDISHQLLKSVSSLSHSKRSAVLKKLERQLQWNSLLNFNEAPLETEQSFA